MVVERRADAAAVSASGERVAAWERSANGWPAHCLNTDSSSRTSAPEQVGQDQTLQNAVRLYWARTLRSLGSLLWRTIGKVVVAAVKRFFGLSGA